jgi:hypothetical protein
LNGPIRLRCHSLHRRIYSYVSSQEELGRLRAPCRCPPSAS